MLKTVAHINTPLFFKATNKRSKIISEDGSDIYVFWGNNQAYIVVDGNVIPLGS